MTTPFQGLLLLGPTGSGKSPLGDLLEERGVSGRRCLHFDFGANLRSAAAGRGVAADLDAHDLETVSDALEHGLLLENERFAVAEKILRSFAARRGVTAADYLVLNGMPRHVGQAEDVSRLVAVEAVVYLECSARTVFERIRLNTGGDRTRRTDDSPDAIGRKLVLFERRTLPLVQHYRSGGTAVITIPVSIHTTDEQILQQLEGSPWNAPHLRQCHSSG